MSNNNNSNNQFQRLNSQLFQRQSPSKLLPYSQYLKQKNQTNNQVKSGPQQYRSNPSSNNYQNTQFPSKYPVQFNHPNSYNYQYAYPQPIPFYAPYQNQYQPPQQFQYYPPAVKPQESYQNQKPLNQEKLKTPKKEMKVQQKHYQRGSATGSSKKDYQQKRSTYNRSSNFDKKPQQKTQDYGQSQYSSDNSSSDQFGRFTVPKRKIVKKDPVLDSAVQIKKWIEARRKNYPGKYKKVTQNQQQNKQLANQMSILENRIRKKLNILNADPRSILKKSKNMSVMKRILMNPQKTKRIIKKRTQQTKFIQQRNAILDSIQAASQAKAISESLIKIESKQEISDQQEGQVQIQKIQGIEQQPIEAEQQQSIKMESQVQQSLDLQSGQAPKQIPIMKEPIISNKKQVQQNNKIQKESPLKKLNSEGHIHSVLTPQEIINHLKQKQREDKEWANSLLSYKSNSLNYNYSCQNLQISLSLEDIFKESVYLLQAIRYMSKNNYFQS